MSKNKKVILFHPPESELLEHAPMEVVSVPDAVKNFLPGNWEPRPDPFLGPIPQSYIDPSIKGLGQSLLDHKPEAVAQVILDVAAVPKELEKEKTLEKTKKQELKFPKKSDRR